MSKSKLEINVFTNLYFIIIKVITEIMAILISKINECFPSSVLIVDLNVLDQVYS